MKMLNYMILFFVLAIISAVFGFTGLAAGFAEIARLLAGLFIVLFAASLIYSFITGRGVNRPL
jgi:hypothetical protein